MLYKLSPLLFCIAMLSSCASLPKNLTDNKTEIVKVGAGPEDMVADTITEIPRILISCNARRKGDAYYGEINAYYPSTAKVAVIKRFEPAAIHFYPHGIDLVKVKDTLILLVVNNDALSHENSILRYAVKPDGLHFLNKITDPLIASPNAVTGFEDGTLLISNDAGKAGNFMEALFMLKRAQIVYWNYNKCSLAAGKFCYSNGITIKGNKVYLASTRQNKIWQFDFKDGKMANEQVVAKVHGPDNIRIDNGNLYVACHLRFLAFIKHMQSEQNFSPTTVYRINVSNGTVNSVFFDRGSKLSAGSTGMIYKDKLYVSGVFDGKMAIANNPK